MANPPPLPPQPAGLWWRTFACLADIIPLYILAWALAGLFADAELVAASHQAELFREKLSAQYVKAMQGNPRELAALKALVDINNPELVPIAAWLNYLSLVTFGVLLAGLSLQESLMGGRTLGKRIFNLKVITLPLVDPPTPSASLFRNFCKAAFFALPFGFVMLLAIVNFHVPLFRRDRRTLHDLWSRTQVVDEIKR